MEAALGLLLVLAVAASGLGAWRLTSSPRRVLSPEREAMRSALHHAIATLPHLRRSLDETSAKAAAPRLRALTQATAVAITDGDRVLALDGINGFDAPEDHLRDLAAQVMDGRVHVQPRTNAVRLSGGNGAAVVAPLVIQDASVGALIALYGRDYRLRPDDARVVGEAAALVSAQVELSVVADQEERLTRAELHALRARISPHFIYNSLAAIASYIHSSPEQARELLAEFAEFTRYSFQPERTYVTLAEELHYVQKYLRLEQARFRDRLTVRVQVDPDVLQTVVPVLSLQPLVENAVKHGVETRSGQRNRTRARAAVGVLPVPGGTWRSLRATSTSASMVGWAFALAASTFCPLFLLGIWWSRLTSQGAAAGIVIGGVLAIGAILVGAIVGAQGSGGAVNALLTQPAIITVPVAFAAMIIVSLMTARPEDVSSQMLALHAPEGLGPRGARARAGMNAGTIGRDERH